MYSRHSSPIPGSSVVLTTAHAVASSAAPAPNSQRLGKQNGKDATEIGCGKDKGGDGAHRRDGAIVMTKEVGSTEQLLKTSHGTGAVEGGAGIVQRRKTRRGSRGGKNKRKRYEEMAEGARV